MVLMDIPSAEAILPKLAPFAWSFEICFFAAGSHFFSIPEGVLDTCLLAISEENP